MPQMPKKIKEQIQLRTCQLAKGHCVTVHCNINPPVKLAISFAAPSFSGFSSWSTISALCLALGERPEDFHNHPWFLNPLMHRHRSLLRTSGFTTLRRAGDRKSWHQTANIIVMSILHGREPSQVKMWLWCWQASLALQSSNSQDHLATSKTFARIFFDCSYPQIRMVTAKHFPIRWSK